MAHSSETTTVNLDFYYSNRMGTSCRFAKTAIPVDDDDYVWIATSLIDGGDFDPDRYERGVNVTIDIPVWLAMKEGLI